MQEIINAALEHQQAGRAVEAEQLWIQVLEADFRHADAWHYRGVAAHVMGRNYDAVAFIERSLALQPENAQANYNLAVILGELGDDEAAEAAYQRTLQQQPDFNSARHNLANLLKPQGRLTEAIDCLQHDGKPRDESTQFLAGLANALKMAGRVDEAVEQFQTAMEAAPLDARLHSQWLFALQYDPRTDDEELARLHRRWNERHAPPDVSAVSSSRTHGGRLRIGFVSPDLGNHPVGIFMLPLMQRLDPSVIHTVCYSDHKQADEFNAQLRPLAGLWRDVWHHSDDQLTAQIAADEIDVLFDLAGHTDGNRLSVFARRAAPVQITWAGYVGGTGLATMDYLLCDRFHVPPELESLMSEQPLRMPNGYIAFQPPSYAPDVAELPALSAGHVTFCAMNNVCKINEQVVDVWAELLQAVADSQLLLKYKGFDDPGVQARLRNQFETRGVSPERILLQGQTPHVDHLNAHNRVDIALDPFPYSGGLTTCESLWMGVPVVTCPAARFASRHSLSHMSNAGQTETIARDRDDYIRIAIELARDLPRLQRLRQSLRSQLSASPLCDLDQFAVDFTETVLSVVRG
ncbi:MAG: tetratricopeptide repeat protein [Planctomycetaceae bacterium]|nr:tetratricopeptide repeat protein [Planctomycetaceae bacterium]MBT6154438.1 tetratricopeptide repeat protein [Planctomycetaceae bacterium]MBT6487249.1 tetratricopeptide repeat protein [Planctomycetaceae bacterium]